VIAPGILRPVTDRPRRWGCQARRVGKDLPGEPRFDRIRCPRCGDVIGVYEPLVIRYTAGPHRTSIAAEPHLFPISADCYHAACDRIAFGPVET